MVWMAAFFIIADFVAALIAHSYLHFDYWFSFVFFGLLGSAAAIGVLYLRARVVTWRDDHHKGIVKFTKHLMMVFAILVALVVAYLWRMGLIPSLILLAMAYGTARFRQIKYDNAQANMMVMITKEEGSFRNAWILRPDNRELWCAGYDKDNHGIALRRVNENEKRSEGHVVVEDDTKKVRLFMWNGNADAKEESRFYIGMIQNPGLGIPRDADLVTEVSF